MLSFIHTLVKYAIGQKPPTESKIDEINNAIERIQNAYENEIQNDQYADKKDGYYKTGNITFVNTDYVVVDNHYICNAVNISINNLKVDDKIYYLAPQDSYETKHEIKRIISVIDDSWDNKVADSQTDIKSQLLTKCIIGKVVDRKNRILVVEPNNISVNLNKVQSDFIPVIGDWLALEAEVQVNECLYSLNGEILNITKIQPLRCKLDIGTISSYDPIKEIGVIGKHTVFNRRICDHGYIPFIGDKVISDSIESDQGVFTWRSLTLVPVHEVTKKGVKVPALLNGFPMIKNLSELIKDKFGIKITDDINIILNIHEEKNVTLTIENVGNACQILRKGCFMIRKAHTQLTLLQPTTPDTTSVLHPFDTLIYIFKCTAKFIGSSEELFIFNFQGFEIGRIFKITVKPKIVQNKLCFKNDNSGRTNKCYIPNFDEWNQTTYIPGIRPSKLPKFIKKRNVIFKIPRQYWNVLLQCIKENKSQTEIEHEVTNAIPCLSNRLCFKSYKDRFHSLLYLEEIAQTINMQQHDIESTIMRHCGEYLVMQVPGLAEKRPLLLIGDRAVVSFKWDYSEGKLKYEGFIHKVTNSEIFLKFNHKFHEEYNYEDCEVTFKCSHSAIQRCHNAVNMAIQRLGQNFLFPTHVVEKEPQLDLHEYDNNHKPLLRHLTHQRADSFSSESSFSSNTSTSNRSNSTTKSVARIPVVQRLFNVKPIEQSSQVAAKSVIGIAGNDCDETNNIQSISKDSTIATSPQILEDTSSSTTMLQSITSRVKRRKLLWFNKNLNYYQKEAVKNILNGKARPLPYIIFGPPGTGKTVTLCEAILQILSTMPESRLLIATPSNSSANLISERLLDSGILKPGDMVRLLAHHCVGSDTIPSKLLPYCATAEIADETTIEKKKYDSVGPKLKCTLSVLGRHRITIGTCIALGILNNMGFPQGHFSHVLVDEAGQATEPEIMIPLNFIHSDYGQVVLAGDPLQLGPVVQSKIAKNFGLEESFLSRLLRHFPYQKDPSGFATQYDPRLITKLVINYRSLPEILELSSSLFYDSELVAQLSSKKSKEAELLQTLAAELPKRKGSPPSLIFHGVNGENCKDDGNPSWYNAEEATQAYLYLLKLYKCGLSSDDIGIITPYQKQVLQIRELLTELNMEIPKISSVEGFQGQERNVIIISAVRSSTNFVNEDIKHSLGFVACPRRLNVAITRARALVIILGNPSLLAQDPYWRSVLIYCINQDSYTGCSFRFSDMEESWMETNSPSSTIETNNV